MVTILNNEQYDFQPTAGASYSIGWKVLWVYFVELLVVGIVYSVLSGPVSVFQWQVDKFAWFLVPLAIQAGRGTLVFFFQLNPARIQSRFSMGIVAATVLLALSLWEAWLVMTPYGMSWTVSVSTLMLIGWVIGVIAGDRRCRRTTRVPLPLGIQAPGHPDFDVISRCIVDDGLACALFIKLFLFQGILDVSQNRISLIPVFEKLGAFLHD